MSYTAILLPQLNQTNSSIQATKSESTWIGKRKKKNVSILVGFSFVIMMNLQYVKNIQNYLKQLKFHKNKRKPNIDIFLEKEAPLKSAAYSQWAFFEIYSSQYGNHLFTNGINHCGTIGRSIWTKKHRVICLYSIHNRLESHVFC